MLMSANNKRLHVGGSKRLAPAETDVVCGRNSLARSHPGNRRFRELIQRSGVAYQKSINRKQKKNITHQVIQAIFSGGGEFLKVSDDPLDEASLEVASEEFIYEKVSHALRSWRPGPSAHRILNAPRPNIDLWTAFTDDQHEVTGEIPHFGLNKSEVSPSSSNQLVHGVLLEDGVSQSKRNVVIDSKESPSSSSQLVPGVLLEDGVSQSKRDGDLVIDSTEESYTVRETLDWEECVGQLCHASPLDDLDLEPLSQNDDGDGEMRFDPADLLQILEL